MKRFNVTGLCTPEEDYMVDIGGKIAEIKKLVDSRSYFTINRARQYGKTTTLNMLRRTLSKDYICLSLSFEGVGTTMFSNSQSFCKRFLWQLELAADGGEHIDWRNEEITDFDELGFHLTKICANRKIVLMIDEVDKASNHEVFLDFLGMLRNKFNERKVGRGSTFHSVILAGVYDIKNIKGKMMREGKYVPTETEDKRYDSPWNIAVNFEVTMSFSPVEIATMLIEYEADHRTGMDIAEISEEIYSFTNGYPFLVSRICQCIDEKLDKNWKTNGVREAVKILLEEKNTLFDDVFKNLENDKDLYKYIYDLLILGEFKPYVIGDPIVGTGVRYGFFKKAGNGSSRVAISNKIFELLMTDYYIAKDLCEKKQITGAFENDIIKSGKFDMELCLQKFAEHYAEIFNEGDIEFLERHGRLLFLSYLKPLINGGGFYHIESQFTDLRRMDIVVDYGREQFIVELKLWRGAQYEKEAYEQLLGYMESKKTDVAYLLTFDFRKGTKKQPKAEWVDFGGKKIFDVLV